MIAFQILLAKRTVTLTKNFFHLLSLINFTGVIDIDKVIYRLLLRHLKSFLNRDWNVINRWMWIVINEFKIVFSEVKDIVVSIDHFYLGHRTRFSRNYLFYSLILINI